MRRLTIHYEVSDYLDCFNIQTKLIDDKNQTF